MRRPLALALLAVAVVATGAYLRVRSVRARWGASIERICVCQAPALARLEAIRRDGRGGLDRVLAAEVQVLQGHCDDLRAALPRQRAWALLRAAPMDVPPGAAHTNASRELGRALGLLCGDEHAAFWEGLRARLRADDAAPPADVSALVLRIAMEHLRVRDEMCARRRILGAPPTAYTLTLADAHRNATTCGVR
mgnify:CR=1 FL=1